MYWNVLVITICLLLLLFLLWKEIRRPNKSWRSARIIASIVSVISLACIALPITINSQEQINNSSPIILLTDGFNNDSVKKILSIAKTSKVFATDNSINNFNAAYLTDASIFSVPSYNNKAMHVFGYGMDDNDISLLKNKPIIFHPTKIENKITSIGWNQKPALGEPLVVQGSFNNTTSSSAKIILSGFETTLDSEIIPAKQLTYFQLSAIPKHLDKAVYSLTILSGKDTVEKEPIPVEVKTIQPLNILMLSSSPDFENKFLKNWLEQNEYKFAVRTTISKSKFDKQFANISPVSLDRITPSLLEKFDVIIADAAELSAMPASEIASIKYAVESKGTGIIVKADSMKNSSAFYLSSFPLIETTDSIQHIIKLHFNDTSHSMSSLKTEQPIYIRNVAGTQPLVKDQQMRIVASSKIYGAGKVVLTAVGNTYSWQLSGNNNDYSAYWSRLLRKAAKKIPLQNVWNITPDLPQKNEEVHLKFQTANANIPQAQVAANMLYPEQNFQMPFEWNATYWATHSGWQPLLNDGNTTYWYVYSNSDWQSIKALEKTAATKKYEREHPYQSTQDNAKTIEAKYEIPKIYFFSIFIAAACFLWFEKKYRNG